MLLDREGGQAGVDVSGWEDSGGEEEVAVGFGFLFQLEGVCPGGGWHSGYVESSGGEGCVKGIIGGDDFSDFGEWG